MMTTTWDEMSDNDRNALIAVRLMGWSVKTGNSGNFTFTRYIDPDGHDHLEPMNYCMSLNVSYEVEEEIKRRDLCSDYVKSLYDLCTVGQIVRARIAFISADDMWAAIHASPELRCKAAAVAARIITLEGKLL